MMELGSRQNMDTKRATSKCIAIPRWSVSFAEFVALMTSQFGICLTEMT